MGGGVGSWIPSPFFSVIHLQLVTLGSQFFVDGVYDGTAEGESAFAAAGTGSDEEIQVGEEFPASVDGVDVGQAGRYGSASTQDEHIGIGLRVAYCSHFLQEGRSK